MNSVMIGEKIRECRIAQKLTQQQLAEAAGITPRCLGDIERGAKVPTLETFINLLNALNASADYVLMDVLNSAYRVMVSILGKSIAQLAPQERIKIMNSLESMIDNLKK